MMFGSEGPRSHIGMVSRIQLQGDHLWLGRHEALWKKPKTVDGKRWKTHIDRWTYMENWFHIGKRWIASTIIISCHYEINGIVGFGMILASIPIGHINTRARHWKWRRNSKSELIQREGNIFSWWPAPAIETFHAICRPQNHCCPIFFWRGWILHVFLEFVENIHVACDISGQIQRCLAHECRNWTVNFTTWGRRLGAA